MKPLEAGGRLGPGEGGEFDRIRAIWRRLGGEAVMGDDCAVVDVGGSRLALSTDLSVEGTHFRLGWLTAHEVGWRAAAAALSDLAAVAATPAGVLASVGVPAEWPEDLVADLMAGVGGAAEAAGARVWGGDLVRSERVLVDVAVVGELGGEPVWRRGAQAGDGLWITGRLGGPGAALEAWKAGREPEASARERFAHPVPRVREAAWLRDHGARAMIDLSDGLVADAAHLAAASGVHCALELTWVPRHVGVESGRDAAVSGEEYELLVALPGAFADAAAFEAAFGLPLTRVGLVDAGVGVTVTDDGKPVASLATFQHF